MSVYIQPEAALLNEFTDNFSNERDNHEHTSKSHSITKPSTKPRLTKVITPDIRKDIISDIKKAKTIVSKRFGIMIFFRLIQINIVPDSTSQ